jgi:CDP-glycerol glycerophosphotransferase
MSSWKWLGKLCSLTPQTKRLSLEVYYGWKRWQFRRLYGRKQQIQPNTVVFESFMGRKYACSPKALYQEMLRDPYYASWTKIWAFCDPENYRFLEADEHTKVVGYRKPEYYQAYAGAKYWVTNSRLPREMNLTKEQEYIQCWHGTPLKKLGFDLEKYAENKGSLKEVQENYSAEAKRITHMPSPSAFYTEKMISAFSLRQFGKENVLLEKGYPRNDRLYLADDISCREIRKNMGIPDGKKVILYAPTWRENQHVPGEGYMYRLQADFGEWKRQLGEEYVVLFRAHYFISSHFEFSEFEDFVMDVSELDDVNELYLAADLLITDYSSVFFDYANLERPILFYMYDYQQYKEEMRDFYMDIHMLPGPVVKTQEDLLKSVLEIDEIVEKYQKKYERFNRVFNPHREACSGRYLREWFR